MKKWERFRGYLSSGVWHVHTTYTDGKDDVATYFSAAKRIGAPFIAFIEHVCRRPTYSFLDLKEEVEYWSAKTGINAIAGCEAKVLNEEGCLDIRRKEAEEADIVFSAFHSFHGNFSKAVRAMLYNKIVDVWAHPLRRVGEETNISKWLEYLKLARMNNVVIELNLKYSLPSKYVEIAKNNNVCLKGLDAHSASEMVQLFAKARE